MRPGPAAVALLGVPYDEGSSFLRGAAAAPAAIREALSSYATNLYTEGGLDLGEPGVVVDAGDVAPGPKPGALGRIEEAAFEVLTAHRRAIFLGGDHAVTYPLVRAVARHHPGLSILHVDAHPDLYDALEGDRFSHACPFARILEEGLCRRLVQVGIRTVTAFQRHQQSRWGIEVIPASQIPPVPDLTFEGPVYLSFDLDGLDPAFAPGVAHHEPGGLSTRDALRLLHSARMELVAADVVELNPGRDVRGVTAAVAAKLVKEVAGRMLAG